jgi:hypothetical protein
MMTVQRKVITINKKRYMNKKQLLLLLLLPVLYRETMAQKTTYLIKADTVRISSSCDTAEFVLQNRTRNIPNGVLTNIGDGVTVFKKIMVKQGDSLYIIGGDTLNIAGTGKNIYNSNGTLTADRTVDGNSRQLKFVNAASFMIANNSLPVLVSRKPVDSLLLDNIYKSSAFPYAGLAVRGTGCDASITLLSDSAGTCNEVQMIDFATLKPRKDSWMTGLPVTNAAPNKFLLGRIVLQTSKQIADYATLSFAVKSDTAFYKDGAHVIYNAGSAGGYTPYPVMSVHPSFKHPTLGYNTKMPFVQVNGGLFVGYGRNWYFNSKNANNIIPGVDDVPGYTQAFYETRFSVYADSLPIKIYKLPSIKANAFLTYSPAQTAEGNNVAFEYKDSVYEEVRNYIALRGLGTPSDYYLKENIDLSGFNGDKLLQLSIRDFNYKSDKIKVRYTGLIAQELKAVIPELVLGAEGNYSIDYVKMVPYLLKLVQDQQLQIDRLNKQQVATTSITMPEMMGMLSSLQQQLAAQEENIRLLQGSLKNKAVGL